MNTSPVSLAMNTASFKLQALSTLMDQDFDSTRLFGAAMAGISPAASGVSAAQLSGLNAIGGSLNVAASGRNLALHDPESAYRMMTVINSKGVLYKAQFAELSRMQAAIAELQSAATSLNIGLSTNDQVEAQLKGFIDQYNGWMQQFDEDMQRGGLLADTQAAQVARRAFDQSIDNRFHGVSSGLRGLKDLGISTDDSSGLASLDGARLQAALASNRQGVVDALGEFTANFAEAARLLNSDGNFMPRQLANLDRALDYIADNSSAWQMEFGSGDAAKPSGQIAQALAAYNRTFNI